MLRRETLVDRPSSNHHESLKFQLARIHNNLPRIPFLKEGKIQPLTRLPGHWPGAGTRGSVPWTRTPTQLRMDALKKAVCERVFIDHGISGTRARRPELDWMLDHLRPGPDEVVVWKLDGLGHNARNLLALIDYLEWDPAGSISDH